MNSLPSQETQLPHIPVMVDEVLTYLSINPNGVYVDGTVGAGGHSKHILNQLSPAGTLVGFDRDQEALDIAKKTLSASPSRIKLACASYHTFPTFLRNEGIPSVNGFLLDLGLSSMQLNDASRGFAFSKSGPLDMRFDQTAELDAESLINYSSEEELANIIYEFGEERLSRRIARSIAQKRPISTVDDLYDAVRSATPPQHRNKSLARVFQAFRIAVNQELEKIESFLAHFMDSLTVGGRIVIMSYHSLEDRMVKHSFKSLKQAGVLKVLTKKPIMASKEEIEINPRSRSAKLRAAERII
ncbi:MAG: 16S rRNA (cytosine(1402)-N(4))-methyltransferase RsmH [Candidatus Marinimicrobia bacterium]|nr:16S rRNA (cytosine(1402)-N(4))-methyltransferase RsmH [Candidatus Neomarinimicrobiota bacterium]